MYQGSAVYCQIWNTCKAMHWQRCVSREHRDGDGCRPAQGQTPDDSPSGAPAPAVLLTGRAARQVRSRVPRAAN